MRGYSSSSKSCKTLWLATSTSFRLDSTFETYFWDMCVWTDVNPKPRRIFYSQQLTRSPNSQWPVSLPCASVLNSSGMELMTKLHLSCHNNRWFRLFEGTLSSSWIGRSIQPLSEWLGQSRTTAIALRISFERDLLPPPWLLSSRLRIVPSEAIESNRWFRWPKLTC